MLNRAAALLKIHKDLDYLSSTCRPTGDDGPRAEAAPCRDDHRHDAAQRRRSRGGDGAQQLPRIAGVVEKKSAFVNEQGTVYELFGSAGRRACP
jgi:hypothetical protein